MQVPDRMTRGMPCTSLLFLAVFTVMMAATSASHFRGGTVSWKLESGKKVRFLFKLGWTYGDGPGCKENLIGQFVSRIKNGDWTCSSGCPPYTVLSNDSYYCTGASQKEDWEQGQRKFTHTFQNDGPFTVSYEGQNWIALDNGKGNDAWSVATTVDLRQRSDTKKANSSPESLSKPIYPVQFGCENQIEIPVIDPDGDRVRCRWAVGATECASVCNALPNAVLDQEKCTITFNTTQEAGYKQSGFYAVAITIEDYPQSPITMGSGNVTKTPADSLSSIPLQFLIQAMPPRGGKAECFSIPRFVEPTPEEKEILTVKEGETIHIGVYADNGNHTTVKADDIRISGPPSSKQSPVMPDVNRTNTFQTTLTWRPSHSDEGDHIVCASVANAEGRNGKQRCFTIRVDTIPTTTTTTTTTTSSTPTTPTTPTTTASTTPTTTTETSTTATTTLTTTTTTQGPTSSPPPPSSTTTATATTLHLATTVTTSPTHGTTRKTIPSPTTAKAPTTSTHRSVRYTGACQADQYDECHCVIRQAGRRGQNKDVWTTEISRRDILAFVFGLPMGLALSVFTLAVYRQIRCPRNKCERNRRSLRYPAQRPMHLRRVSPTPSNPSMELIHS